MCTRSMMPVFISCKTCAIRTEALNELAILRDRFGGKNARAIIVSAEPAGASARNRAAGFIEYRRSPLGFLSRTHGWQELVLIRLEV